MTSAKLMSFYEGKSAAYVDSALRGDATAYVSEFFGSAGEKEIFEGIMSPLGIKDGLGASAINPDGTGCFIVAFVASRGRHTPHSHSLWTRLATNNGCGMRLRTRLVAAETAKDRRTKISGERLTPREREVVGLAKEGHSNKLIGHQLGITTSTVGVLLWRATAKVGASSRAELIRLAQVPPEKN